MISPSSTKMVTNPSTSLKPSILLPLQSPPLSLSLFKPQKTLISLRSPSPILSTANPDAEIDLFLNPATGVFVPRSPRVVVLWDLDNKPPRGPPYAAALSLRRLAELLGHVDAISAYANRHAFSHLPSWVLHHRRTQRRHDLLERKGLSVPDSPYLCSVCGRKLPTNLALKKHFRSLHQREREKKLNRLKSLKGKKRQRYKERFIDGNVKYEEAARELLTPRRGYGLATELRRAGVFVKTVEDKPQAADWALKRQMQHSMTSGIDWLVLVSDDSDFKEMIRRAKEENLRTVVVGDGRNVLGRNADLWVPWTKVENGEVGEEELRLGRRENEVEGIEDGEFLNAKFYERGDGDMDQEFEELVDEIVDRSSSGFTSAFSEEDDDFDSESDEEDGYYI